MKKKRLAIGGISAAGIAAVIAVVTTVVVLAPTAAPSVEPTSTAEVTTQTIVKSVSGRGSIDAGTRATAAFRDGGTVTSIAVTVGQSVTVGQVLATIDPAAADLAVRRAQDARWNAGSAYETAAAQLSAAQAAVVVARAALAAASPDSSDPAALAAAVRDAESQVITAQAAVVQSTVQVNDADRDVAAAQSARDATVLKAPLSGVVIAVNGTIGSVTSGGGTTGESGATAATTSGLIQIADITHLVVTAQIAEADITDVAAGQPVTVTLPSTPDVAIAATVASVAPIPITTDGVVKFPVTVRLTDVPAAARLGLTALVSITTQEVADVLALPVDAVTLTSSTEGTVQLQDRKDPAKTRSVSVTVGLIGSEFIEIRGGLKRGDVVVLPTVTPAPTEPGTGPGFEGGMSPEDFG